MKISISHLKDKSLEPIISLQHDSIKRSLFLNVLKRLCEQALSVHLIKAFVFTQNFFGEKENERVRFLFCPDVCVKSRKERVVKKMRPKLKRHKIYIR